MKADEMGRKLKWFKALQNKGIWNQMKGDKEFIRQIALMPYTME